MALTNPSIDVASLYYFSRKLEEVLNASLFYAREIKRVVSQWAVSPPPFGILATSHGDEIWKLLKMRT